MLLVVSQVMAQARIVGSRPTCSYARMQNLYNCPERYPEFGLSEGSGPNNNLLCLIKLSLFCGIRQKEIIVLVLSLYM